MLQHIKVSKVYLSTVLEYILHHWFPDSGTIKCVLWVTGKKVCVSLLYTRDSQPVGRDPQRGRHMILGGSPDDREVMI